MLKKSCMLLAAVAVAMATQGCATKTRVIVPEGGKVVINARERAFGTGNVKTRPYGWGASHGIPYAVVKDGQEVSHGVLPSSFRVASLFWPPPAPLALAYWPLGFAWGCYDLRGDAPVQCTKDDLRDERVRLKRAARQSAKAGQQDAAQ